MSPAVVAVSSRPGHHFSKTPREEITLIAGIGVEGDGHAGERVKHRSRARYNPSLPNLRQVHLLPQELLDEVATAGFSVEPGEMGENVLTTGVNLISLPKGTRLRLGEEAEIEITGLRNPCVQIERFREGLLERMIAKDDEGNIIRKAGVMSIVLAGGVVRPGDLIHITLPPEPHEPLERV